MTNKQCERRLAQALGALHPKTDFSAVAGAMPVPATTTPVPVSRLHRVRRYVAAVAAAAVMVAGVGTWYLTRPEDKPPVIPADTPLEDTSMENPVTTLNEAKAAIADGRYEAAYFYLLTDNSKEAVELRDKFFYVPVGATDTRNGELCISGNWTYDEMGFPGMESFCDESSGVKRETKKVCTYDTKGRLKTKTLIALRDGVESSREEYTYTYDAADHLIRTDYICPSGYSWRWTRVYTYDDKGNCVREEFTDDKGQCTIITSTYNEADQLLVRLESYVEENAWHKQEYTYDAAGRVLTDAYLSSSGSGWTYTYTYDENGVQTSYSHTLPDYPNHWQKWYMDGTKKVSEDCGNNYSKSISENGLLLYHYFYFTRGDDVTEYFYTYDDNGNCLTSLEWMETWGDYTVYVYDNNGNCVKQTEYTVSDRDNPEGTATFRAVTATYTYVYDAAGRVLEKKHTNEQGNVTTHVYAYDDAGRLTREGRLDKNGNFIGTETAYTADGLLLTQKQTHTVDNWNSVTYTYDRDGHRIAVERTRSNGTWSKATYDAAGNLLRWEDNDGLVYAYTWELRYYPDGLTDEQRAELEAFRDVADELNSGIDSGFENGVDEGFVSF